MKAAAAGQQHKDNHLSAFIFRVEIAMLGFSGLILTKMLNHMARDMQFPGFQAVDPVEVVRFQIIIHLFQRIAQLFARQANRSQASSW
jgi:hypothetical protein